MTQHIDLSRFIEAQKNCYQIALKEIKNGRKRTHWMWFVFPQIQGLGKSSMSQKYAIQSREEAIAFLNDPYLGSNLREICSVMLGLETHNPRDIFEYDAKKLRSCMTLFAIVSEDDDIFDQVLAKFFDSHPDRKTLKILGYQS